MKYTTIALLIASVFSAQQAQQQAQHQLAWLDPQHAMGKHEFVRVEGYNPIPSAHAKQGPVPKVKVAYEPALEPYKKALVRFNLLGYKTVGEILGALRGHPEKLSTSALKALAKLQPIKAGVAIGEACKRTSANQLSQQLTAEDRKIAAGMVKLSEAVAELKRIEESIQKVVKFTDDLLHGGEALRHTLGNLVRFYQVQNQTNQVPSVTELASFLAAKAADNKTLATHFYESVHGEERAALEKTAVHYHDMVKQYKDLPYFKASHMHARCEAIKRHAEHIKGLPFGAEILKEATAVSAKFSVFDKNYADLRKGLKVPEGVSFRSFMIEFDGLVSALHSTTVGHNPKVAQEEARKVQGEAIQKQIQEQVKEQERKQEAAGLVKAEDEKPIGEVIAAKVNEIKEDLAEEPRAGAPHVEPHVAAGGAHPHPNPHHVPVVDPHARVHPIPHVEPHAGAGVAQPQVDPHVAHPVLHADPHAAHPGPQGVAPHVLHPAEHKGPEAHLGGAGNLGPEAHHVAHGGPQGDKVAAPHVGPHVGPHGGAAGPELLMVPDVHPSVVGGDAKLPDVHHPVDGAVHPHAQEPHALHPAADAKHPVAGAHPQQHHPAAQGGDASAKQNIEEITGMLKTAVVKLVETSARM